MDQFCAINKIKMKGFFLMFIMVTVFSLPTFAQCSNSKAKAVKVVHKGEDVVDIAINSKDHTTLVAAVKAAGLVETLKGDGPFTIFAPTNAAFADLPAGTVETLLKQENIGKLTAILTYHVVADNLDSKAVVNAINSNGGKATVKTVNGGTLTVMIKDGEVWLQDENGGTAKVTAVDLKGSNGIIHVIDQVVLPK